MPLDLPLDYPVYVEDGILDDLRSIVDTVAAAHRYAVIADSRVAALHADRVMAQLPHERSRLFTIPPGEQEKTRARWSELTDALLAWGAGRDTTIIALGGGVIGDLAGFVAATYLRGVPVVQVPTTLLAMVDAAIGGKTAVDTSFGKNLVGAFHNPRAVVMDPRVLETLSPADLRGGLAEVIKHGVIADANYFDSVLRELPALVTEGARGSGLSALIAGSVAIKATVVSEDSREDGLRHILNFGHTLGHAIERVLDYQLSHGDAVSMGMVLEARLSERLGVAGAGLFVAVADALSAAGLPTALPEGIDRTAVLSATRGDKKNREGAVRYALPRAIGEMEPAEGKWSVPVDDADVWATLSQG